MPKVITGAAAVQVWREAQLEEGRARMRVELAAEHARVEAWISTCPECGVLFVKARAKQRRCTPACRQRGYRARHAA